MLKNNLFKFVLVLSLIFGAVFFFFMGSENDLVLEKSYNYSEFASADLAFENKTVENINIVLNNSKSSLIKAFDINKSFDKNFSLSLDINLEVQKALISNPDEKVSVIVRDKNDKRKFEEAEVSLDSVEEVLNENVEVLPNREYYVLLDSSLEVLETENFWNYGFRGDGVRVAILDTGVESDHFFLGGNVVLSESFVGGSSQDGNGHGTHVAGIVNAVAPGVEILSGKVLSDNGAGSSQSIANGIYWATDNNANVISMSLGAPFVTQDVLINDAIDYAINKGVIVVVASGNCGSGFCGNFRGVTSPGSYQKVITVGAVDNNLNYMSFSSGQDFGSYIKPDVVAPGVNIMSSVLSDEMGIKSGTSMATPHIAGLVALLLEKNSSLEHFEVKYLLESNSEDLGVRGKDAKFGSGFVQVNDLLLFDLIGDLDEIIFEDEVNLSAKEKNLFFEQIEHIFYKKYLIVNESLNISLELKNSKSVLVNIFNSSKDKIFSDSFLGKNFNLSLENSLKKGNYSFEIIFDEFRFNDSFVVLSNAEYDSMVFDCDINKPQVQFNEIFGIDPSSNAVENEEISFTVMVSNCGIGSRSKNVQAGLIPRSWGNVYEPYEYNSSSLSVYSAPSLCSGNDFFDYKNIYFNSGNSFGYINFNVIAPNRNTVDECASNLTSAWDDDNDFLIFAGSYNTNGGTDSSFEDYITHRQNPLTSSYYKIYVPEPKFVINDIDLVTTGTIYEGDLVTFRAEIENIGIGLGAIFAEGGVMPKSWVGSAYPSVNTQSVSNNVPGECNENSFIDSKIVSLDSGERQLVEFKLNAPTRESIDECNSFQSAWDNNGDFRLTTGLYDQAIDVENFERNYTFFRFENLKVEVREEICEFPFGTSLTCKCGDGGYACLDGYICDETVGTGQCVEDTCVFPFNNPNCPCTSNSQCGDGYYCDFFDETSPRCKAEIPTDECEIINEYSCENGNVYRCEDRGSHKELKLVDNCLFNEICDNSTVNQVKQCVSTTGYDMQIEKASSGTTVYKQFQDSLIVNLKLDVSVNSSLIYDSNNFELLSSECLGSSFSAGEYNCEFRVKGSAGKNIFVFGKDVGNVEIIDNPYSLYVTNFDKLYDRYKDDAGVNVLLEKTYDKASKTRGIVYDLDREISINHPYLSFFTYDKDLSATYIYGNDYVLESAKFVHSKCGDCSETVIVGDDYVVPSYIRTISEYDSSLLGDNIYERNIYTDISYTKRDTYLFSDFDNIFKFNGEFEGKDVIFVLPENVNQSILDEINNLQNVLIERGYNPSFENISGNDVYCQDDRWFNDLEGKILFLIGIEENNRALTCYPFVQTQTTSDFAFIERNLWDGDEYAVIINTNEANVITFFARHIEEGTIVDLKGHNAYLFHVGTEIVGYTAMGIGAGALIIGSGGVAAPAILLSAGVVLDGVADAADVADTCVVNNQGVGWCGTSIAFAATPIISSTVGKDLLSKVNDIEWVENFLQKYGFFIERYFKSGKKYFGNALWNQLNPEETEHVAIAFRRILGDDKTIEDLPRLIKFTKEEQLEILKAVGRAEKAFGFEPQDIKRVEFKPLKYELGSTDNYDAVIEIGSNSDINEILNNVIFHEYGHRSIYLELNNKEVWELLPGFSETNFNNLVEYVEFYNEFRTKSLIDKHELLDISNIQNLDDFNKDIYLEFYESNPQFISNVMAQAKIFDPEKHLFMKNFLISRGSSKDLALIDLSDKYVEAKDFLELTEDERKSKLISIKLASQEVNK